MALHFGLAELKVLLCITCETLGWHRNTKKLTIRRIGDLIGMDKTTVMTAVQSLLARDLVTQGAAGRTFWYQLKIDEKEKIRISEEYTVRRKTA